MPRPVITAKITSAAIVAWVVPAQTLLAYLPEGLTLDTPHPDLLTSHPAAEPSSLGVVSLMGVTSTQTRLWSIALPGHTSYHEIALRIHCRLAEGRSERRGVLNIKRFISTRMWRFVAARIFNEQAHLQDVREETHQYARSIETTFSIHSKPLLPVPGSSQPAKPDGTPRSSSFKLTAAKPWRRPAFDSVENWLKEPNWVFTKSLAHAPSSVNVNSARSQKTDLQSNQTGSSPAAAPIGSTMAHEILHPAWSSYPITAINVDMDMGNLFGPTWSFLQDQAPAAGALALGSSVAIFSRKPLVRVVVDRNKAVLKGSSQAR